MLWNSDSEKTQSSYISCTPNSNRKVCMTGEWWYLKLRHSPKVEHALRGLKSLFTEGSVEIHLNVPCSSWDWGWPLAAGHGFSVTVRTTEVSRDKALLSLHQGTCTKRVKKFPLKHTLHLSVWVTLCPHPVHLQGTHPPEEMCEEALRSREVGDHC